MKPTIYINRLWEIAADHADREITTAGAVAADRVLTDLLTELGYTELVKAYEAIPKRYA